MDWQDNDREGRFPAAQDKREELSIGKAGISVKTMHLNTVATVATMVMVSAAIAGGYQHITDSREGLREMVRAMQENTVALRERNCLERFPPLERLKQADFCKGIAR